MKNFIENQQFNYINDVLRVPQQAVLDELSFELLTQEIDRFASTANISVDFLVDSMRDIENDLERWHKSYIEKIAMVKNGAAFIQGNNLASEDPGHYGILEIDTSINNSVVFSIDDAGYTMPPYDERYAK